MKFVDEYRDNQIACKYSEAIKSIVTKPWTIMEVCGGQTHSIVRFGIGNLLPEKVRLVHGPGCPVCVTPVEIINKAITLAGQSNLIFCSFGDMLRVPGTDRDLLSVKAEGGDIRIVYSPLDALVIAKDNPDKQVVFFAVGFETTAPANAMAVYRAAEEQIGNFSILVSHVLVPPAIEAILSSPQNQVQGFLAAGHVCTVMGYREYEPIASKYKVPIVVTGFEPLDILQGLYMCLKQLEEGRVEVENQYIRSVERSGNLKAQDLVREVFRIVPRRWRGIGEIPSSGLGLQDKYSSFDAENRFNLPANNAEDRSEACISGMILQGLRKPYECPEFDTTCSPEKPLGATMVSSEGACSAYYRYQRFPIEQDSLK